MANKTVNFHAQNEKAAWKKQNLNEAKFDVCNFHADSYKRAFSNHNHK